MFTLDSIYDSIVRDKDVKDHLELLGLSIFLEAVDEEDSKKTLKELQEKIRMPWGDMFPAEYVMTAANFVLEILDGKLYELKALWKEVTGAADSDGKEGVYLLTPVQEEYRPGEKRPAAVICPGGGYSCVCVPIEGIQYAEKVKEAGYVPFILVYRVAPEHYPAPQKDLALAVKYVRSNAEKYGISPDNLLLMGSSAGGHLCASMTALHEEIEADLMRELGESGDVISERYQGIPVKPEKLSLSYPVVSFTDQPHEDSFQCLTGGREELREKLSVEKHITKEYPKTFIWLCEDDDLVPPENGKSLYRSLEKSGVESKLCVYPSGGHGCGLAQGTSAEGWIDEMLEFMKDSEQEQRKEGISWQY